MKTLFIDFDGTLCQDRFWQSLPAEELALVQTKLFQENFLMVIDWMLGEYTSEEVNEFVSRETGILYQKLWETFVHDCTNMKVSLSDLEIINQLRNSFYTILITSNMDAFDRFVVPSLGLENYFDKIVNSYNEGLIKRDDGGILFIKHLKGDIKDAILLEDNLDNCETFRKLGGNVLYVSKQNSTSEHLQNLLEVTKN